MSKTTQDILNERQKTHGNFNSHANLSQKLKQECYNHTTDKGTPILSNVQREGMDMILHKIARIMNGDSNEPDHWKDIAGYAELVARHLEQLPSWAAEPPPIPTAPTPGFKPALWTETPINPNPIDPNDDDLPF